MQYSYYPLYGIRNTQVKWDLARRGNPPGSHGNDLVGSELESACSASWVCRVDLIHELENLQNALILPQVLSSLDQEGVFLLVIAT